MPLVPDIYMRLAPTAVARRSRPRMAPAVCGFAAACWAAATGSLRFTSAEWHGKAECTFVLQVIEEFD